MQDFDTSASPGNTGSQEREHVKERIWDLLLYLFKRFIIVVSFGTGVLGFLWLLGKIFKR